MYVGRLLVQPQPKSFQLVLQQLLVLQRLEHVQDYEDQTAGAGHCDDLTTSTLAVFCSLNDTGEVEELEELVCFLHVPQMKCKNCASSVPELCSREFVRFRPRESRGRIGLI